MATPLSQRDVKALAVVTVDAVVERAFPGVQGIRLFANRSGETFSLKRKLTRCAGENNESILDVSAYLGNSDPFRALVTAESEAYASFPVTPKSSSEDCGYLWDLFKLLQVPSPIRIFFARASGESRRAQLEERIESMVQSYAPTFDHGDQVFSIVFPTAQRNFSRATCHGWTCQRGKARSMRDSLLAAAQ